MTMSEKMWISRDLGEHVEGDACDLWYRRPTLRGEYFCRQKKGQWACRVGVGVLRVIRPDLPIPEPGQCIEVSPAPDARDALIKKLVEALGLVKDDGYCEVEWRKTSKAVNAALSDAKAMGYGEGKGKHEH